MKFSKLEAFCLALILLLGGAVIQKIARRHQQNRPAEVTKVVPPAEEVETRTVELNFTSGPTHWPDRVIIPVKTPAPKPDPGNLAAMGLTLNGGAKMVPPQTSSK
jgi:hypothetical protein